MEGQEKRYYEYKCLIDDIIKFIVIDLAAKFPEINGAGFGLPFDLNVIKEIQELPEDKRLARVRELSGIRIMSRSELTEEQKGEIIKAIGERFFSFTAVGEIKLQ